MPRARNNLVQVEKIEAPDDLTVVFTLKQPFGPFLGIFEVGSMPMVPKHLYEGTDFKTNPYNNAPIGTGPFMFKEWQKGSFIRLVKNPNYHEKGKPYIDEIYWQIIPDAAARSVAYETGKVDVLPGGSVENFDVPRLSKLKDTCVTGAGWEFFSPLAWLWLNNRAGPTANKKVRQAIMYAIDRDFAKDVIWNGLGKVATGPSASTIKFYTDDVPKYPFDPAKAKALLKEAGYNGEKIRLMPLAYGETWQRWGEAVKQNLQDVGMNIETIATDVPAATRRSATGTTTSPSPISTSTAIPRSASAATTSPARSPRARCSTTSRAIPTPRSTSCSPTARSRRRIPSARRSTRRRRRSWSRTCRWRGCSNCSFRPSPAARSRT